MKKILLRMLLYVLIIPSFLMASDLGTLNDSIQKSATMISNDANDEASGSWIIHSYTFTASKTADVTFNLSSTSIYAKAGTSYGRQNLFRRDGAYDNRMATFSVSRGDTVYLTIWEEGSSRIEYNFTLSYDSENISNNIFNPATIIPSLPNDNPAISSNRNAMILTRYNDNSGTAIYAFHIDTQTDEVSNFHLVKNYDDKKFRSLAYHDGKFITAAMNGELYSIDIDTGNLSDEHITIDRYAMSLDFDEDGNILYNTTWSNDLRKLKRYNIINHTTEVVATIDGDEDGHIDDAIAYIGNGVTQVSVTEKGGLRVINNGNIGTKYRANLYCLYGADYVGNGKTYFINAKSDDLSLYKFENNTWSRKLYDYGQNTTRLKGMALAISKDTIDGEEISPQECTNAPSDLVNFSEEFDFNREDDVSGNGSENTVATYKNIATVNGKKVDLKVKVVSLSTIDRLLNTDTTPKGFKFQQIDDSDPSVGFFIGSDRNDPIGTKYEAELEFSFVEDGTDTPISFNFETQVYDIDNFENRTEKIIINNQYYKFFQTSEDTHIKATREGDVDIFENFENEDSQDFNQNATVKFVHEDKSSFVMKFSVTKNQEAGRNIGKAGFNLVFGTTKLGLPTCARLPQGKFACSNPKPFELAYTNTVRGDTKIIGNTILCADQNKDGRCEDPGSVENDELYMINMDIDSDNSTFNSSSAKFIIPEGSEILWARLFWQGAISEGSDDEKDSISQVKFKVPNSNSYIAVDKDDDSYEHNWVTYADNYYYQASIDITTSVKEAGEGWYSVANVYTSVGNDATGGGSYGGWSIVIAYKNNNLDLRNIAIYDGYMGVYGTDYLAQANQYATENNCDTSGIVHQADIELSGFLTPRIGKVNSKVLVFAGEGDQGITGDQMLLKDKTSLHKLSDSVNGENNIFNSSITDFGEYLGNDMLNPHPSSNTSGIDIDMFDVSDIMENDQNSTVIRLTSDGDAYYPSVFAFSTQVYEPKVCYLEDIYYTDGTKYEGEAVRPGTLFDISTIIKNEGTDRAIDMSTNIEFANILEYSHNSIKLDDKDKTDRTDDDEAEANDTNVTARLGINATGNSGGYMDINDSTTLVYKARVLFDENQTQNIYNISYTSDTLGISFDNVSLKKCKSGVFTPPEAYEPIKGNYNINESDKSFNDIYIRTKIVNKDINLSINELDEDKTSLKNFKATVGISLLQRDSQVVKYLGEFELDGNSSRLEIPKFKVEKAYKDLHARVYYCQDKYDNIDTDWNSCYKVENNITSCKNIEDFRCKESDSLDNFAVRPDKFSFGLGIGNQISVKAGEDFNVSISALDIDSKITKNYNEFHGTSFRLDAKQIDSKCDFNKSRDFTTNNLTTFLNGELNGTLDYKDVGILDINISEISGQEFALVDRLDPDNSNYVISPDSIHIKFIPDHFNIDSNITNNMTDSKYAFYSSNDLEHSPRWNIHVKAVNKDEEVTLNYNKECVANDVDIFTYIDISAIVNSDSHLILNYAEDNSTSFSLWQNISHNMSINKTLTISHSSFNDGVSDKNITVNFTRSKLVEEEPVMVTFKRAKAIDHEDNIVFGEKSIDDNITYKYMRAYIQSPIEVIGSKELDTTVYYEAYDPYGSGKRTVSGERGWKVVSFDDTSKKMKFENIHVAYGNRVAAINDSNVTLNVTATNIPEKNKITLTLDPDFRYITDTISTEVSFTPDSANWAGDGSLGMMVDTNVSRRTKFKRMQW